MGVKPPSSLGDNNMSVSLFGWEFRRRDEMDKLPSFTPKQNDDGAIEVAPGGAYGTYVDLSGSVRNEAELVTKYREMALHPECDAAIDEIINETISIGEEDLVKIDLDKVKLADPIKDKIQEEFTNVLTLLDFNNYAYDIVRRWYIDGRLFYHTIIDEKDPKAGLKEVRYIDPRKIRKIREVVRKRVDNQNPGDATVPKTVNEYFMYNDRGFNVGNKTVASQPQTVGLRIAKDSILYVTSGITDTSGSMVLSYLHIAIKPLNQLRTLEDALVIYRLSRAPERRIWYIDVGNLPKIKAEQYVRDIMVKHKNRLVYDAATGDIKDDRKFMTMLEDYWLPRREGGRGTEVTTLPGGQTLGQMDDVLYFQKRFFGALHVPISRLNPDALFSVGRATEITRDELKFAQFIIRLRNKFSSLFLGLLEKQVVLKGIMSIEEWQDISKKIRFDFSKDNYFTELKTAEITSNRTQLALSMQELVGIYYSHEQIRKDVLQQNDEDIKEIDAQIEKENNSGDPRWINMSVEQKVQFMNQSQIEQEQFNNQQEAQEQHQDMVQDNHQMSKEKHEAEQAQASEGVDEKKRLEQAQQVVDHLKIKKSRTMQEEAELKKAIQILAQSKGR